MAWSIAEMKQVIKKTYPNGKLAKNINNMSDAQVYAIFNRIMAAKEKRNGRS